MIIYKKMLVFGLGSLVISGCAWSKINEFLIRTLFLGHGRFAILLALVSAGITMSSAATDIDQESSCYELSNPEAKEQLLTLDGKVVCVAGKLTIQPHAVYFDLRNNLGLGPEIVWAGSPQCTGRWPRTTGRRCRRVGPASLGPSGPPGCGCAARSGSAR